MARAKGLPVVADHGRLRRRATPSCPNLTGFAMQLGFVLGGSILVEYTFSYPGPRLPVLHRHDRPRPAAPAGAVPVLHARGPRLRPDRRPRHGRLDPRTRDRLRAPCRSAPRPHPPSVSGRASADVAGAAPRSPRSMAVLAIARRLVGLVILLLLMLFVARLPGRARAGRSAGRDLRPAARARRSGHLLGTTQVGEDVYTQLIWGTRPDAAHHRRRRRPVRDVHLGPRSGSPRRTSAALTDRVVSR